MFDDILREARTWGESHHPNASSQHHAAFANSVMYATHRMSGGFGGPSIREHAANKAVNESGIDFADKPIEDTYKFVEPFVYGELTSLHYELWSDKRIKGISFDNDEADVKQLNQYGMN